MPDGADRIDISNVVKPFTYFKTCQTEYYAYATPLFTTMKPYLAAGC